MASRIKGITIELDGETKGLDKALSGVNKKSSELYKELKDVERALKFNPGNVELLAQQQELLSEQVQNSTKKLGQLKDAQKQVEAQFKSGEIGATEYRAFQREVIKAEGSLDDFKKKLKSVDDGNSLDNVKKDMKEVKKESDEAKQAIGEVGNKIGEIGAIAGGAGVAGAIAGALDVSGLDTQIDISFEISDDSKTVVKQSIRDLIAYGVEAEEALEGVRRQWALNADASDSFNAKVIKGAGAITRAYQGLDFIELVQEVNEVSSALKITDDEALGLVDTLLGLGFPPEQVDIIAEYGTQLQRAGYNAEEVQAIMAAGVDVDSWNIDSLLDGIKEGRIKIAEFGAAIPEALKDAIEGTKLSKKQFDKWGDAVAKGGTDGSKAMQEVASALDNIKDETKKNEVGVAVFGTLYEENGQAIIDTLLNAKDATVDLKEGQEGVNEKIKQLNDDPLVKLKDAMNEAKVALAPLFTEIAKFIEKIATWAAENPELVATLAAVVGVLGALAAVFMILSPIITGLITLAGALSIGILPLIGIFAGIIASIGLLIAAGIALYKNWDTIKENGMEIWNGLGEFFTTFFSLLKILFNEALNWIDEKTNGKFSATVDAIRKYMDLAASLVGIALNSIKGLFKNNLAFLKALVTGDFKGMVKAVSDQMDLIEDTVSNVMEKVEDYLESIDLRQIGIEMIRGLINGIQAMAGKLLSTVEGLMRNATAGAEGILDINSPSKVFEQIGKYTGEGFIVGMNKMGNSVSKAGQLMAGMSVPKVPSSGFAGGSGNSHTTTENKLDFAGMFDGAVFNVREEQDIKKLAKLFNDYVRQTARKGGVIMP